MRQESPAPLAPPSLSDIGAHQDQIVEFYWRYYLSRAISPIILGREHSLRLLQHFPHQRKTGSLSLYYALPFPFSRTKAVHCSARNTVFKRCFWRYCQYTPLASNSQDTTLSSLLLQLFPLHHTIVATAATTTTGREQEQRSFLFFSFFPFACFRRESKINYQHDGLANRNFAW